MSSRKLAIVTGASSGIGLEIAKLAAKDGYDLHRRRRHAVRRRRAGAQGARRRRASRSRRISRPQQGVDQLLDAIGGRPVDVLVANAGHGLGHGFLDQSPRRMAARHRHQHHRHPAAGPADRERMVERGEGRVLITGSIAGHMAGAFQAVYNGCKAFIDSFSAALEQGDQGQRRHRHLPQARRDRDRFLPPRGARRHQGRPGEEGRSGRRRQGRLGRDEQAAKRR